MTEVSKEVKAGIVAEATLRLLEIVEDWEEWVQQLADDVASLKDRNPPESALEAMRQQIDRLSEKLGELNAHSGDAYEDLDNRIAFLWESGGNASRRIVDLEKRQVETDHNLAGLSGMLERLERPAGDPSVERREPTEVESLHAGLDYTRFEVEQLGDKVRDLELKLAGRSIHQAYMDAGHVERLWEMLRGHDDFWEEIRRFVNRRVDRARLEETDAT